MVGSLLSQNRNALSVDILVRLFKKTALSTSSTFVVGTVDEDGEFMMSKQFLMAMMEEFKGQRVIHRRYAFHILLQVCLTTYCVLN